MWIIYASCLRLANFNSAVSLQCTFVSAYCMCHSSVLMVSSSYVSVQIQYFKTVDISTSLLNQKYQSMVIKIAMVACITCMPDDMAVLLWCNSPKHPCRHARYPVITESIVNDLTWGLNLLYMPLHMVILWHQ